MGACGWALAIGLTASAPAAELHVPAEFPTIGAAVGAAHPGDVVRVAAGAYPEADVAITVPLAIVGEPGAQVVPGLTGGGAPAALFWVLPGGELTVEALDVDGGGLATPFRVERGTLRATDVIARNGAGIAGAGLWAVGATVEWVGGAFVENHAEEEGGHVYATDATITLRAVVLDGASARTGAAIYASGAELTLDGAIVSDAVASDGAVVGVWVGGLTITGSTFEACTGTLAIAYTEGADVRIDGSRFLRNVSGSSIAYFVGAPSAEVSGNLWCDDDAGLRAIKFSGGAGLFRNNFVVQERTGNLGVTAFGATVEVVNNTFVAAVSSGGGSALATEDQGVIEATNNVVVYGQDAYGAALWGASGPITFAYGLLFDNAPAHADGAVTFGEGVLLDVHPGFDPPVDDGCAVSAYVPGPGSPLVDAGDPAILDGDGSRSDLGATGGPDPNPLVELVDGDQDGFLEAIDCDDGDATVHPGAAEVDCDGIDQDCDDAVDEDPSGRPEVFVDGDGDGYGGPSAGAACAPGPGTALVGGDCDDADPAVSPAGTERRDDGVDQDCDGRDLETTLGGAVGLACGCRAGGAGTAGPVAIALLAARRRSRRATRRG